MLQGGMHSIAIRNFLAAVQRDEPPLFSQSRTVSQSQRQCRVARGGTLKGAGSQTTDFTDDTDKIARTGSHLVRRRNARLVSVESVVTCRLHNSLRTPVDCPASRLGTGRTPA